MMITRLLIVSLLLIGAIRTSGQPVFPCSTHLQDAYGICSHITREATDFNVREKDLSKMNDARIGWVRSDFDWHTVMKNGDAGVDFAVFDATLRSCEQKGVHLLPILDRGNGLHLAWEVPDNYLKYVHLLVEHYKERITHWEVINEANLIRTDHKEELGQNYADILKTSYQEIKHTDPLATIVYGGQSEVYDHFLEGVCSKGGQNFFDIMNFHSYSAPEELINSFCHLAEIMHKYDWSKPVWLTETGYATPPQSSNQGDFMQKVVPIMLRKIGKNASLCTLGVVYDEENHIPSVTEDMPIDFKVFKSVQYLNVKELKNLSALKVPVLICSYGEFFPEEYVDDVVNYVRHGGTLVCPQGVPFYYDHVQNGQMSHRGADHQARLHLGFLYWWNDEAKKLGAPEVPEWHHVATGMPFDYGWNFSKENASRYLTNRNLKDGDEMIPIVEAGNDHYKGCVAALYKLRSDLRGNIIIQTRLDQGLRSESVQAKRLARAFLISFAYGIDRVFWYNLRALENSQTDWEAHYGILHKDFAPKPAFLAYQTLTEMCPDGSLRPKLRFNNNVYQADWQRPDGSFVSAFWTTGPEIVINIFSSGRLKFFNYLGQCGNFKKDNVKLGNGVLYVVSDKKDLNFKIK
jgi:hypothetical protein